MGAESYAAARNNERASAAQQAVANGLDTLAKEIDAQDAAIEAFVAEATPVCDASLALANSAESVAVDAHRIATLAHAHLTGFESMTFWQRVNWLVTGRR